MQQYLSISVWNINSKTDLFQFCWKIFQILFFTRQRSDITFKHITEMILILFCILFAKCKSFFTNAPTVKCVQKSTITQWVNCFGRNVMYLKQYCQIKYSSYLLTYVGTALHGLCRWLSKELYNCYGTRLALIFIQNYFRISICNFKSVFSWKFVK